MSAQGHPQLSLASFTQPLSADDAELPESLSPSASVSEMCKMNHHHHHHHHHHLLLRLLVLLFFFFFFFFWILFHITLNFCVYRPIIFRVALHQITGNFR
jgi:hypothetical protein